MNSPSLDRYRWVRLTIAAICRRNCHLGGDSGRSLDGILRRANEIPLICTGVGPAVTPEIHSKPQKLVCRIKRSAGYFVITHGSSVSGSNGRGSTGFVGENV